MKEDSGTALGGDEQDYFDAKAVSRLNSLDSGKSERRIVLALPDPLE
jgi:hypothetical protein